MKNFFFNCLKKIRGGKDKYAQMKACWRCLIHTIRVMKCMVISSTANDSRKTPKQSRSVFAETTAVGRDF